MATTPILSTILLTLTLTGPNGGVAVSSTELMTTMNTCENIGRSWAVQQRSYIGNRNRYRHATFQCAMVNHPIKNEISFGNGLE